MKKIRAVRKILSGTRTIEGAGVRLNRVFGHNHVPLFDPFLLLDDFHSSQPKDYLKGFPWHPHRGIETVTYVLEGEVDHGDSLGNKASTCNGEVQWTTAGSGIIHQEMPHGNHDNLLAGLQLWVNLPATDKMCSPRYQGITPRMIPVIHIATESTVKIIAGAFDDLRGPVDNPFIDPVYFDVALSSGMEFVFPTPVEHTFFVYVLKGSGYFGLPSSDFSCYNGINALPDTTTGLLSVPEGNAALFTRGELLSFAAGSTPVRFLLIGGRPSGEPVAWYGPIVMNTEEELKTAFEEFQVGTFIKHG